jgi:hypothetical protein
MTIVTAFLQIPPVFFYSGIFLIAALLILWFTRPLPDWFGFAYPYGCIDYKVAELQKLESDLIKIRRNQRFKGVVVPKIGLVGDISIELQIMAVRAANDLAFEVFLLDYVWKAKGGDNYRRFRLEESPYKNQIESYILPEKIKKIVYG